MSEKGTIEVILTELSLLLEPLADAAEQPQPDGLFGLVQEIGLDLNDILVDPTTINETAAAISSAFSVLRPIVETGEVDESMLADLPELIKSISNIIDSFDDFDSLQVKADFVELAGDIGRIIFDYLMFEYLASDHPKIFSFFLLFGVAKIETKGNKKFAKFDYQYLPKLFTNPADIATDLYKWGTNDFDSPLLLKYLKDMFWHLGVDLYMKNAELIAADTAVTTITDPQQLRLPIFITDPDDDSTEIGFALQEVAADGAKFPGLAIIPFAGGQASFNFNFPDSWELIFKASADASVPYGLVIRPGGVEVSDIGGSTAPPSVEFSVAMIKNSPADSRMILIGSPDGPRLELGSIGLITKFDYSEEVNFSTTLPVKDSRLIIDASEGDGFLQNILPNDGMQIDFEFSIGWSSKQGFFFEGSGGLEIVIPTHISLGPIDIEDIAIGMNLSEDEIPISLGASIRANLGPLTMVVENMGLKTNFSFPPSGGNLGPVDFEIGFKPPNGIGLSIDAGAIKGGGYLFFDFDREEYAGALELIFSEWIALKAVGIVTTRLPDNSKGFSLLIIITVEFGSGIQLGFGFTLLGVGGLLGLNRTVKIAPLTEGVRTGAAENIMFPQDVIANAPQIISDLKKFFPAAKDVFLIGPMAKIGYGTPTLISLTLGVIIESNPLAITILGVIKAQLPDENSAVLKLQVNFIGRVEPSNNLLWFKADLFDSRILFITIEGGMGLLVNWSDNSNFVISVGGFHPRYNPPPLPFPVPTRLAVSLLNKSNAKIRIEGYFAVTSNTAQFGARAELYFGFSAFNVDGHLSFDALFQFDPFYFIFEFSLGMSVKVFGFGLFTFSVTGLLEGPTRWHIKGTAKWKITWLGPTIKVRIDTTWGEEIQTELLPISVYPLIEKEFNALTNWEAVIPANSNILVTLRKLGEAGDQEEQLVLHPVGRLRIRQRKLPLGILLEKIGNQRPDDINKITVTARIKDGEALTVNDVQDKFATGEFKDLDNAKKLSSPGFELYDSGVEIQPDGEQLKTSMAVKRIIRPETIIIDNNFKRYVIPFFTATFEKLYAVLFGHFIIGSAISKSTLSYHYKTQRQPNDQVIQIVPQQYSVAFVDTNKPVGESAAQFTSQASANDHMHSQIKQNPGSASQIHVIPNTEVNRAA